MSTRASRDLLRTVVPPLLALGLVALLTRPVDTAPAPAYAPARPASTAAP